MKDCCAPGAELGIAKLIETDVGVPLPLAGLLHNERHQSGECGGRGRGAPYDIEGTLRLYQVTVMA